MKAILKELLMYK